MSLYYKVKVILQLLKKPEEELRTIIVVAFPEIVRAMLYRARIHGRVN